MLEVWTEKYRPDSLDEVVNQEEIISRLKAFVEEDSVPHLLFAGPAGTGKTTSAIALAKDYYGDEWQQNFKEMNASDERGIDIVREEIKSFARTKSVGEGHKIIFLDEADALTSDAQQALRRTMEQFSSNCRFILSCNYSSKIIDPIQSRCAVFRFNRLDDSDVKKYIKRIAENEEFKITEDGAEAVLRVSQGDMRRVTNILQTASIQRDKVSEEDVYEAAASLKPDETREILETALSGDFIDARDQLSDLMIERGLDGQDVLNSVHREIFDLELENDQILEVIEKLGDAEFRISEGASSDIQIESFLSTLARMGE